MAVDHKKAAIQVLDGITAGNISFKVALCYLSKFVELL